VLKQKHSASCQPHTAVIEESIGIAARMSAIVAWIVTLTGAFDLGPCGFPSMPQSALKQHARQQKMPTGTTPCSFANNGLAGQQALPLFDAAFAGEGPGPDGKAGDYTNGGYTTMLQLGQVGTLANVIASGAGLFYLCNLVPATSLTGQMCSGPNVGYTGAGGTYPESSDTATFRRASKLRAESYRAGENLTRFWGNRENAGRWRGASSSIRAISRH